MWGLWCLPGVFIGFSDSHGEKEKNETYLAMAATWGFYPLCHCYINACWASHIEVVILEGKTGPTGDDQDYRSEHISVMVAGQLRWNFRENQEDHSWKDTMVGTGETMVEHLK